MKKLSKMKEKAGKQEQRMEELVEELSDAIWKRKFNKGN
jgi:hypothetical protein